MTRSPPPRAPQARPRTRARTMPPDVSALAGNDHQDRVLGLALHGTNRPNPAAWPARQPGTVAALSDLENVISPDAGRVPMGADCRDGGPVVMITDGARRRSSRWPRCGPRRRDRRSAAAWSPARRPVRGRTG